MHSEHGKTKLSHKIKDVSDVGTQTQGKVRIRKKLKREFMQLGAKIKRKKK